MHNLDLKGIKKFKSIVIGEVMGRLSLIQVGSLLLEND